MKMFPRFVSPGIFLLRWGVVLAPPESLLLVPARLCFCLPLTKLAASWMRSHPHSLIWLSLSLKDSVISQWSWRSWGFDSQQMNLDFKAVHRRQYLLKHGSGSIYIKFLIVFIKSQICGTNPSCAGWSPREPLLWSGWPVGKSSGICLGC